jgi:hypothetical protein
MKRAVNGKFGAAYEYYKLIETTQVRCVKIFNSYGIPIIML